ncbi:MAG: PmoA family protein [Planctomycetia bacterium]|nr:PmoA family protein [Planctomycetia bacterium]
MKFIFTLILLIAAAFGLRQISAADTPFQFQKDSKSITLLENGSPIWKYNYAFLLHDQVPVKDQRRMFGSYFHPVYGMNGEILTDDAPKDHYHHHGIFWTWPHVLLHRPNGSTEEYDLWLGKPEIRQHFVRFGEQSVKGSSAIFEVENGWYIGPVDQDENGFVRSGSKIMKEIVRTTTGPSETRDGVRVRSIDFEFTWTPLVCPISLGGAENKSYGGFSVRFHPPGPKDPNTIITTSAKTTEQEEDILDTPLSWGDFTSTFTAGSGKKSGGMIMVPSDHPDFAPTWMTRHYGAMCVGWPGVNPKMFPVGKPIKLHYRLWIHEGLLSKDRLQSEYDRYKASKP